MAAQPTESGTPRAPADSAKRGSILDAASRLFLERGYEGTSMDRVSDTAGVSKATLYAHFRTKENLFAEIIARARNSVIAVLDTRHAAGAAPEDVLRHFARAHGNLVLSPLALALQRLLFAEGHRVPGLTRTFFNAGPARILKRLTDFLRSETAAGRLTVAKPQLAAEQFVGMVMGPPHIRHLLYIETEEDRRNFEERVDEAVRTFLARYAPD